MSGAHGCVLQHEAPAHCCKLLTQGQRASPELSPVEQLLGMRQGARETGLQMGGVGAPQGGPASAAPQGGPGPVEQAQPPAAEQPLQRAATPYSDGSGGQAVSVGGSGSGD
jgi:hypothetical protein